MTMHAPDSGALTYIHTNLCKSRVYSLQSTAVHEVNGFLEKISVSSLYSGSGDCLTNIKIDDFVVRIFFNLLPSHVWTISSFGAARIQLQFQNSIGI